MKSDQNHLFPKPVILFQEKRLPETAILAGYAAIIEACELDVPLPRTLTAIGKKHVSYIHDDWRIMTPRHQPAATLVAQLTFALKYEGVDLAVLKQLFEKLEPGILEAAIKASPTGKYVRRLWFFYEWLMGKKLDAPDTKRGDYVEAINPEQQFAVNGTNSPRHRVRNNLPGTVDFCPLVFRTKALETFMKKDLKNHATKAIAQIPKDIMVRTAAFLLLQDSKSSFAIEQEFPPQNRIQRWGRAISLAGTRSLDMEELLRLQKMVIADERFIKMGIRDDFGFVGAHEHETGYPLPAHISAHHKDLNSLMEGLIKFDQDTSKDLDPVLAATVLAFGFVYIHPFFDGNGRIHRYLIHHVLSQNGFNPPGIIFPVSAAILEWIDDYRLTLESYSERLLPSIEWQARKDGNVEIMNETVDFYRYFDATPQTEFLYACVEKTIKEDLPREARYLQNYDRFKSRIDDLVAMSDRQVDLLFRFLRQNKGQLSKRALSKEFSVLNENEARKIETIFSEEFLGQQH